MRKGDPVKEGEKMVASDRHPTYGWFTSLELIDYNKIT